MHDRPLGRTGVQVSNLCLGTMMFGAWGNQDHDDSIRIIHAALDAGVNFVDTADVYSAGESEEIVGKALKGRRDDVVLADLYQVHRPDPAVDYEETLGALTDLVRHREPAAGRGRPARRRDAGSHRRDRQAGRKPQPGRHQLRRAGPRSGASPPLS